MEAKKENLTKLLTLVKEIQTGDETYPDYKSSMFKPEKTSLPIFNEEKSLFKNVPVADGKVDPRAQQMVKDFLLKRDHDLEEFAPKKLNEEQQVKVNQISAFLTGKSSPSFNSPSSPSSDDFELEGAVTSGSKLSSGTADEDDFFSDFD